MSSLISADTVLFIIGLLTFIAVVNFIAVVWLLRNRHSNTHELKQLGYEMHALNNGAIGIGQRLVELDQRFRRLVQRQEDLDNYDPGKNVYQQATKLFEKGCSFKEVATACQIPEAEARLLSNLHGVNQSL